jgi:hypothetical protein
LFVTAVFGQAGDYRRLKGRFTCNGQGVSPLLRLDLTFWLGKDSVRC